MGFGEEGPVPPTLGSEAKRVAVVLNLMKTRLVVRGETNKQQFEKILEKNTTSDEELCKGLPMEFILYLKCCKSFGFYERRSVFKAPLQPSLGEA